jgi:hypothetical protein
VTYDAFAARAEELFGIRGSEVDNLLEALEEQGYDIEDLSPLSRAWGDAADLLGDVLGEDYIEEGESSIEEGEESPYDLDPFWPDDDYLDAGEEWELAPGYEEN